MTMAENPPIIRRIPGWPRRHWRVCAGLCALALIAVLAFWRPWQTASSCGPGLTAVGSPYACVGLDLDSSAFSGAEPPRLGTLEKDIAAANAAVTTGSFDTVVLLEDMTPNPAIDGLDPTGTVNAIEGAVTAVNTENEYNQQNQIGQRYKLLLANFGSQSASYQQAVTAIESAQRSWHITAVTGLGQSLVNTRVAEAELSADDIVTIGGEATADNMNIDPATHAQIENYFRVGPTNSEEADAAAEYINAKLPRARIMVVYDTNPSDDYAATLYSQFLTHFTPQWQLWFSSAADSSDKETRAQSLAGWVQEVHGGICSDDPDLIYFAGRGTDLGAFLTDFANDGTCGAANTPILSGDDASYLIDAGVVQRSTQFTVYYTALAYPDQWSLLTPSTSGGQTPAAYQSGYQDFASAFAKQDFPPQDLEEGSAMIDYDAVRTALTASFGADTSGEAGYLNPGGLVNQIAGMCQNPVSGSTGLIAFGKSGNAVDKAIPVLKLTANARPALVALEWAAGAAPAHVSSLC
jgi:ABC-type branched-subunit amino acid transport system substrate-binding protein